MSKLTFAIIGCRHFHIQDFIKEMLDMGHHCSGIYEDRNIHLRTKISDKFQLPIFNRLEDLFTEDLDIVGCASKNSEKITIVELCEKHGINIMVDKPIITSDEGYERLKSVIEREKIQVGLMLTERFQPIFMTLKNMIQTECFGEITHISMRKPHRLSKESREEWFFEKNLSGGIIIDLCIHDFDLLRWLTNKEITTLQGYMTKNFLNEYPDFYDTASLHVLLDDELPVQLYVDWHTPSASWTWGDGRVFITGTKGCAELRLQGDPFISNESLLLFTSHEQKTQLIECPKSSLNVSNDFIARTKGEDCSITHEDILKASKLTLEADRLVAKKQNS
ncbi:Gfo/Idh/MocA family protein [Bacillus sp. Marseille-Q3570]|uniref:Gfo/Idh/MocA family protein n=1 Tax=Bacillus sp. Marseille-Q3570 TaxID=2963522 RepID=UPI0021B7A070|nr:Gfo/Idh/MocA family oxidoreductase [Bacillus sp. Marseille-Q3570]